MCGAIDFYGKAQKLGVKPIFGCDVYMKRPPSGIESRAPEDRLATTRLVLLAMNLDGYQALCRLVSRAYLEGLDGRPQMDPEWLRAESANLIALCGGLKSSIGWNLTRGEEAAATEAFQFLQDTFGDRFYAELQACQLPEVKKINEWLIAKAQSSNVKLVATSNVHYLAQEDADSHEILTCIRLGKNVQDGGRGLQANDFWMKSPEDMQKEFAHLPEALSNTLEVADRCNLEFHFVDAQGSPIYHLPTYEIPAEEKVRDIDEFLMLEGTRGLEWRFSQKNFAKVSGAPDWEENRKRYYERLKMEVDMIRRTGYGGYFLIVMDFIRWAKLQGIPVGPGRGSGAGSIVAWALRITDIDPMPFDLLFERFINPERVSMPDFDVDFCQSRREEVIDYVKEKYGKEKVSQIITFGRLQTKNCIRDVGRVLGMPYGEVDQIAKLVPDRLGIKLREALELEPRLKEMREENPIVDKLFKHALKLEGLIRNFGKHAGGVIITDKPLMLYSPLYTDEDGSVMTQFDKDASEKVGLVKFDFLGLKTLTHIQYAVDAINEKRDDSDPFRIEDVPIDQKEQFELVSKGGHLGHLSAGVQWDDRSV